MSSRLSAPQASSKRETRQEARPEKEENSQIGSPVSPQVTSQPVTQQANQQGTTAPARRSAPPAWRINRRVGGGGEAAVAFGEEEMKREQR